MQLKLRRQKNPIFFSDTEHCFAIIFSLCSSSNHVVDGGSYGGRKESRRMELSYRGDGRGWFSPMARSMLAVPPALTDLEASY